MSDRYKAWQAGYRPDIDGLRALAVLPVVLFHTYPQYVPGGFVGVDVFFVVSGYLISGIIFKNLNDGAFSLRDFYIRRIRRIFPALILVITASASAGLWLLLPSALEELGQEIIFSSLFVANVYFWMQSGYFSPSSETLPLLHLWSLGVEEQFYIFWPIALLFLPQRLTFRFIAVIGTSSFIINLALMEYRDAAFYLPFSRAWELMLGAAIAFIRRPLNDKFLENAAVITGVLLIAISALWFDKFDLYPSWRALLPTVGAALIVCTSSTAYSSSILASHWLVQIGRFSYPLYLWHWPILVFGAAYKRAPLTLAEKGLSIGFAFLFAWLTYKLLESPLRARHLKISAVRLAVYMALVGLAGLTIIGFRGFEQRFPEAIREIASGHPFPSEWRIGSCFLELDRDKIFASECVEDNRRPLIAVWGDSTAAALMPGLRHLQTTMNFGIAQLTAGRCPPFDLRDKIISEQCPLHNKGVMNLIASIKPDIVLLHGVSPTTANFSNELLNRITALKNAGVSQIVVLSPVPVWKRGLPNQTINYFMANRQMIPDRSADQVSHPWDDPSIRTMVESAGAIYVSGWDVFCNSDGCLTRVGNKPSDISSFDEQHLTSAGSIFLLDSIKPVLIPLLRK